jgi:heme exporter protein D
VALVVAVMIGWIAFDYRAQKARLRVLEQSGISRRSGRSATDIK